ncbi:hypothetical protein RF11_07326 [Thelohanellus kitauei]|uniref:Uncharacterized protein n=1 Tax=Thelohanellus kitauei TaxID=669202 RepID=A0A0C2IQH0_THEKT|nr:hypothetical protein RF11_07326 [Thelohanellus kitauei]
MLIFGFISSLCVLALLGLKIYKLMNFDKKKEIKKSAGNDKKSILGNIYDVLGIVLLVSDDIMSFVFISYIFAVYNGPTGYGCLECLLQVTTCQKESQYIAIISQSKLR